MYPFATKPGFKLSGWVSGCLIVGVVAVGVYIYLHPAETPLIRAQNLIRAGKAAAALPILEALSRKQPADASIFPWLAQGYLSTERLGEGRTALDTAIRTRQPVASLVPVVLAYVAYYQVKGDLEEAEKLLESAQAALSDKDLVEGRANLYVAWADSEARSGRLKEAIARLDKAQSLVPDLREPLKTLIPHRLCEYLRQQAAIAELTRKSDSEAIALLKRSLAVADEPATRMALAAIYKRQGKLRQASENYRLVCQADANNLEARHRLVDLFVKSKDYRQAQEALLELTDKERSVENYQLLGWLNLKLGNYAGAVRAFEDATNLRPKDALLLTQLKRVLLSWSAQLVKQGKTQESISVKGHADRVAEMLARLGHPGRDEQSPSENKGFEPGASQASLGQTEPPPFDPRLPPVALYSARIWLSKGSLTPEGEIRIKNITGRPVPELALTVVFYDKTSRARNGAMTLPVASQTSPPFPVGALRTLYFSCPNIVKPDHQLAVVIFWKGRLLKELPVVKQH